MKIFIRFLCLFLNLTLLCSCANSHETTTSSFEILNALIDCEIGLPAGNIYDSQAQKGDKQYVSKSILSALYGDNQPPQERENWLDYAFFLSYAEHPCEFSVIHCNSFSSTEDTAKMLLYRLDTLKNSWKDSQYKNYTDLACVTIIDNYVILVVSSDVEHALKTATSLIK